MDQWKARLELSRVALGEIPADTVISRGTLFNAFTGEFLPGRSVWIKGGRIAYVGPDHDPARDERTCEIDADGMVLLPGLIDGHTHVVARASIEEFVRYAIPTGVTTVVTETIELASVLGADGIACLVRALEDQPIRFYHTAAPLCALTPTLERLAPPAAAYRAFLEDPACLGVGEIYWGNMLVPGVQGERVREIASAALDLGKRLEGHTAGARGRKLHAYTCLGFSSCHEPISEQEVLELLRLGYWVMLRQGGIRKELEGIRGLFQKELDTRRLVLSTDSVDPVGLVEDGYLDASLRDALELGVPPALAYRMVTLNVAEHFGLEDRIGGLAPGRLADIVIIPSPGEYTPRLVLCGGRKIFEDGRVLAEPRVAAFPGHMYHSVRVGSLELPEGFPSRKARAMELVTRLVTAERIVDLDDPGDASDVLRVLALDRSGGQGAFMGLLKGFGLERGACGSTSCWDTVDMIVVGADTGSMKTVVRRLAEIGGGAAYAVGGELVAEVPAPLGGVMSVEPMETLCRQIKRFEGALRENGVPWEKPLLTLDTLGTAAIPHLRITHEGYVRLKDRAVLPVAV